MILLDPDLEPELPHGQGPVHEGDGPALKRSSAKKAPLSTAGRQAAPAARNNRRGKPGDIPGNKPSGKKSDTKGEVQLPSARTLGRFLSAAQTAVRLRGQVTVLLTTDAAIRKLNRQFRGKNKATDVLSFPAGGPGAEGLAGDLAISVTTALRQAAEQGHSLSTEIKVLVLHGLLHLAGGDHETDDGRMARRERQLRTKLKLPQGLIERVEGAGGKRLSGAKAHKLPGKAPALQAKSRTLLAKAKRT